MPLNQSMVGAPIYTQDGDELGTVKEVRGRYFKVDAPMQADYWLSEEVLGPIAGNELRLTIPGDRLGDYKTDEPVDYGDLREAPTVGTATTTTRETTSVPERESVQLREEQLRATKEETQAGEVRIGKDVVTEHREMDVPVRHEEVVVERHPVEGRPAGGDIREGEALRVPVSEERVEVEKEPVLREEVSVRKEEVTEPERVSGEVRREEPRVEQEGDVRIQERENRP